MNSDHYSAAILSLFACLVLAQVAIGPAATSCLPPPDPNVAQGPDGNLYVTSDRDGLTVYDAQLRPTSTGWRRFGLDSDDKFAKGLERGPDGNWWLLLFHRNDSSLSVTEYTPEWERTGTRYTLNTTAPVRNSWEKLDFGWTNGRWWLLANDSLYTFSKTWDDPTRRLSLPVGTQSDRRLPTGLSAATDSVWVSYAEGRVVEYDVSNPENPQVVGKTTLDGPITVLDDVVQVGDGSFWAVSIHSGIAQYTDGGAYSGRSVGTLTGSYCENPRVGGFLLSGIAFVFYLIASVVGIAVATTRSQPMHRFTSYLAFGAFAALFAYKLLHYGFTPPLAQVYSIPDVLLSLALLGVVALEYGLIRTLLDDVERTDVLALLLVNLPLVASALLYPL